MAAPTVTSATPATGAYSGGTPVLMVGAGFTGATVVAFGASTTTGFTVYSDTLLIVAAPAHAAGAVAVSVTTAGGTGSGGTFTYTGAPALFTVAQARAFDKGQLANGATFPDAVIAAEEAAIRAKFERIIGIALSPTVGTEYHDADGRQTLFLGSHNPFAESPERPVALASVTTIDSDGTETDFTVGELADLAVYAHKVVRRSGVFPHGYRNIKVVYTHGYVTPPADIVTAALLACIQELVPSSIPSSVIDGSDGNIKWSRVKDPERGRWYGNEAIDAVLREHRAYEKALAVV